MSVKRKLFFSLCLVALLLALCACGTIQLPPLPGSETAKPSVYEPEIAPPTPAAPRIYTVRRDYTPFNSEPSMPETSERCLAAGSRGIWVGEEGDFVQLSFSDGSQLWVHRWFLTAEDTAEQQAWDDAWLGARTSSPGFTAIDQLRSDGITTFVCVASEGVNCRSMASTDSPALTSVSFGATVTVLGSDSGFYLCQLDDGGPAVYCSAFYLAPNEDCAVADGIVDLRAYLPDLRFEMLFASPNNITGEAMYPAVPLLGRGTAEMLAQAEDIFLSNGYTIKIYDAYRPKSAQYKLYDIVQDSRFIANPYRGNSWHQLGRAVDISLIDLSTGEELEMPTPMHTFDVSACRFSRGQWSETARANADYMTQIMQRVGFGTIETEWWHFEYTAEGSYMDPNLDFNSVEYRPLSELLTQ